MACHFELRPNATAALPGPAPQPILTSLQPPRQISPMTPLKEQTAREEVLRARLIHALREKHRELSAQLVPRWAAADAVYWFYHQSFKVCAILIPNHGELNWIGNELAI